MTEFIRVKDPDKPGDYLVLAKGDYDPAKHQLFEAEPEAAEAPEAEPEEEAPSRKKRR